MFLDKDIAGEYDKYRAKSSVFYTEQYMLAYIKNAPDYIRCAKQSVLPHLNSYFITTAENNLRQYTLFLKELNRLRQLRDDKNNEMHNQLFIIAQEAIGKLFLHFPNFQGYSSWLTTLPYLLHHE